MSRVALLLLSLLIATASLAQTRIDAGVALGAQPYEESEDSTRVLTGAEVLFQHNSVGLHVAVEYTDLSFGDAMYAKHFDAIYRHAFAGRYSGADREDVVQRPFCDEVNRAGALTRPRPVLA